MTHLVSADVSAADIVSRRVQLSHGAARTNASLHSPSLSPADLETVAPGTDTLQRVTYEFRNMFT